MTEAERKLCREYWEQTVPGYVNPDKTEAERIENDADQFALLYHERNRVAIIKGYVTGATAENERLQQKLTESKIEADNYNRHGIDTYEELLKTKKELKSAQGLNMELVEALEKILTEYDNDRLLIKVDRFENLLALINKSKSI